MFFKGVLASLAGPGAQTTTCSASWPRAMPREACLMNGMVNVVLYFPRYMMITGITVLALGVFHADELQAMKAAPDFEKLLPIVLQSACPVRRRRLLLAGLLAAFMSNFAATINAAPAYIVNDIYKRFINPDSSERADRCEPRGLDAVLAVGIVFGVLYHHITDVMMWIVGASTAAT